MIIVANYLPRCAARFIMVCSFITCILFGAGMPARAAFPIQTVSATNTADTAKTTHIKIPTEKRLYHMRIVAVIFSFVSIGFSLAAAIASTPGLLIAGGLLSIVGMITARSQYYKRKKYTFAEVISFIAFLPVIIFVSAFFAVPYIIFVLPRKLVNKIRGKKGTYM